MSAENASDKVPIFRLPQSRGGVAILKKALGIGEIGGIGFDKVIDTVNGRSRSSAHAGDALKL